jgi:hypothetical protein
MDRAMVMSRFQPDSWRFDVDHPYRFLYRPTHPAPHPPCTTACCCPGWRLDSPTGSGSTVMGPHQETGSSLVVGNTALCVEDRRALVAAALIVVLGPNNLRVIRQTQPGGRGQENLSAAGAMSSVQVSCWTRPPVPAHGEFVGYAAPDPSGGGAAFRCRFQPCAHQPPPC